MTTDQLIEDLLKRAEYLCDWWTFVELNGLTPEEYEQWVAKKPKRKKKPNGKA